MNKAPLDKKVYIATDARQVGNEPAHLYASQEALVPYLGILSGIYWAILAVSCAYIVWKWLLSPYFQGEPAE